MQLHAWSGSNPCGQMVPQEHEFGTKPGEWPSQPVLEQFQGVLSQGKASALSRGVLRVAAEAPFWDVEPNSWWADLTWNPKLLQALVSLGKLHKYTSCGLWSCWKALFESINLLLFVSELLFSLLSSFGVFQKPALRERTFSCLEKTNQREKTFDL